MSNTPGFTLDPKDEAELEAAFGVTSNAEELVRQNAARYSREHLAVLGRRVDGRLTATLYRGNEPVRQDEAGQVTWQPGEEREFVPELEDAIGHPIEAAVVRGSGRNAAISYAFVGPRGGLEKDFIPYAQVFGSESERKRLADQRQGGAVEQKLAAAEHEAAKVRQEAREAAEKELRDAREAADRLRQEADEEAADIRRKAAEEAAKEGEKQEAAEKEPAKPGASGAKAAPRRQGKS